MASLSRADALLAGLAPPSSAALGAAYRAGLRATAACDAAPSLEPLTPRALAALLSDADARLRALSTHALLALARAAADECGARGDMAAEAAAREERINDDLAEKAGHTAPRGSAGEGDVDASGVGESDESGDDGVSGAGCNGRGSGAGAAPAPRNAPPHDALPAPPPPAAAAPSAAVVGGAFASFHEAVDGTGALGTLFAAVGAAAAAASAAAEPAAALACLRAAEPELELLSLLTFCAASDGEFASGNPRSRRLWPEQGPSVAELLPLAEAAVCAVMLGGAEVPLPDALPLASVLLDALACVESWLENGVEPSGVEDGIDLSGAIARAPFFCAPPAIRAFFRLLARAAGTPLAWLIAENIVDSTNDDAYLSAFCSPDASGIDSLLDAISSTVHTPRTLGFLIIAATNLAVEPQEECAARAEYAARARMLVYKDIFSMLQPALVMSSTEVVINAASLVATLAVFPDVADQLDASDVLPLVADSLRAITFGRADKSMMFNKNDVASLVAQLADARPTIQLVALHVIATASEEVLTRMVFENPPLLAAVRGAAASADAFVYGGASFILHAIGEAVPAFRARDAAAARPRGGALEPARAAAWSIEQVAQWVGAQPFRAYKPLFREHFVSGRVLLSLTDADLATSLGVSNAVHRKALSFAIDDLRAAAAPADGGLSPSGGGGVPHTPLSLRSMGSPPSAGGSPRASPPAAFDVFLSYRRAGGADFAQLLKLLLKAHGLSVFLDVENLGKGNFSEQLVASLTGARNVVLVWSRGCLDRFLDGRDAAGSDFVRLEYATSLQLRKNIVPVYKEDFEFPAAGQVPGDVRGVFDMNAVKCVPARAPANP